MASAVVQSIDSTFPSDYGNIVMQDAVDAISLYPLKNVGVVVVIPCYNEVISIGSLVLRSQHYTDHIVVIDDGSNDKTTEVARLAGARVIRHKVNRGKGASIKTAFSYAKAAGADILVLLDGDGQHNPDEIPLLIEPILKGEADIVNGSRFLAKAEHNVPKYRRIGQEFLTFLTNSASRQKLTDSQNGFRAFSRKSFDCFSFLQKGMGIESEMLIDATNANLRIKEIQINVRYDVEGSTLNPFIHGLSVTVSILKTLLRQSYGLAYLLCGVALLLMGTSGLAYILLSRNILTFDLAVGYTVSIFSLILGTLCLFALFILRSVMEHR